MIPFYVIAATVPSGNRVTKFYGDSGDAARFMVMNAGILRHSGFDLKIGALPEIAADGSWRALWGNRKDLRLYQDGTVIFRAAADESFLGWGQDHEPFLQHPRLNPVAVVEVHASFVTFYRRVLERLAGAPAEVLFRMSLHNHTLESGQRLYMTRHLDGARWEWIDEEHFRVEAEPPQDQLKVEAAAVSAHPLEVAYLLVERFYRMFDMPSDLIPFVREQDGRKEIDVTALARR
jgi:hypothetical protein